MISCRRARALLVDHVRGGASEAALLQLDMHLGDCAECRRERARWETMSALKDWQPAPLGGATRERILKKLVESRPRALPVRRAPRPALMFAGAALAMAAGALIWPRHHAKPAVVAAQVSTVSTGEVKFAGAEVTIPEGTVAALHAESRTIALDAGELVVAGRSLGLRVATHNYVFRLTEAHAAFAPSSVRVVSGTVWVYTLDEQLVATVNAGESWPAAVAVAPKVVVEPVAAAPVVAAAANKIEPKSLTVQASLERARTALADGDAPLARRHLSRALSAATSPHDRAEAELFGADSYLVEKNPALAVERYRHVASAYAGLPEGEAAAFAAAQVLSESNGSHEAFRAYLDRYPDGRFAREARDRLADSAAE